MQNCLFFNKLSGTIMVKDHLVYKVRVWYIELIHLILVTVHYYVLLCVACNRIVLYLYLYMYLHLSLFCIFNVYLFYIYSCFMGIRVKFCHFTLVLVLCYVFVFVNSKLYKLYKILMYFCCVFFHTILKQGCTFFH